MTQGERLRQLREERNMSLKELEEKINIPFSTLASWERGDRKPKISAVEALADVYNVDVGYLLCTQDERTRVSIKDYDDVIDFLCELKQRPEGEMFFATLRGATKEDILKAVKIIDALKGDSN